MPPASLQANGDDEEEELDPIADFFKSYAPRHNPNRESSHGLRHNFRTFWQLADADDDEGHEEAELDPIADFFKSHAPRRYPNHEGGLSLRHNRRTFWHLTDADDDEDHEEAELDSRKEVTEEKVVGTVGEVLRNMSGT